MTKVEHLHATTGRDLIKNTRELPNPSSKVTDSVILINTMHQKILVLILVISGIFMQITAITLKIQNFLIYSLRLKSVKSCFRTRVILKLKREFWTWTGVHVLT